MKTLTFYFALRSPYSALASDLVYEAASSGAFAEAVEFRVTPFANRQANFLDPTSNPLKLQYMLQDLPRLYKARGLPIQPPNPLDVDFSLAAGLALAAQDRGLGVAFVRAISLLRWSEGRNVAEQETLLEAAERAGWSSKEALAALDDNAMPQRYESAITAAEEAGVFGVPFFIVSDGEQKEPFWGQDRWPMVLDALSAASMPDHSSQ